MATEKDFEQDEIIARNTARIEQNEKEIQRQTQALEMIRDHYYPVRSIWYKAFTFVVKVICIIVAYAGFVDTTNWYRNSCKAESMAKQCAEVAQRLFLYEGDLLGATQFLEKAVKLDASTVSHRIELAYVKALATLGDLFGVGRPLTPDERTRVDAALAEATFLQEVAPDEAMPHVLAAQSYMLRGEKSFARASIEKAIVLCPTLAPVHISACAVAFNSGDGDTARKQIAEAERLNPDLPLVFFWKGMLALTLDHDVVQARGHFHKMLQLAPRLAQGHAVIGRTYLAEKTPNIPEARAAFTRALTTNPTLRLALLGMSETYEREGNARVACLWLDRLLNQDANCLAARLARARLLNTLGKTDAALADLSAAIALTPLRADIYRTRAQIYEALAQTKLAEEDRQTAAALEKK